MESYQVSTKTMALLALASTAGLTIEFYTFYLFGVAAATVFPKEFFPGLDPTLGIVISFLAFSAGFPARIIGAFLFGHYGDKIGRKFSFMVDLTLVGVGGTLTGVLPGAATIGVLAPILLVILRVITGLGLGGEFGGATALLAEFGSKRKYRAFWTGFANAGFSIGGFLGAVVLGVFSSTFTTIGWRIGFLLTLAIVIPSLIARYAIAETPHMVQLIGQKSQARFPSISVFRKFTGPIILLALFSAFQQFDGYAALTYMVSYMDIAGYSLVLIAFVVGIGRLYDFAGLAVNGWFSRVFKRRTTGIIFLAIPTVMSYPYVLSILSKNIPLVLITELLLVVFGVGAMHAFAPVLASEQFPTKYRYSGSGLAYEISAMIGGMFTPAILSELIGKDVATRYYYIPAFYVIYFVIGLFGILLLKETKDISLEALDAKA